jgi:hypothetical protein
MLSLAIHHNIYLSRDDRYALHNGTEVTTVGVSVPVWFMEKTTSEPAREVFCRYVLKNPHEEVPVQILEDGYEICLPCREGTKLNITDEEWRGLFFNHPDKLNTMYRMQVEEVSSKNLLDARDGGCGGLAYREHNKINRSNGSVLTVMHYVTIEPIEVLLDSITSSTLGSAFPKLEPDPHGDGFADAE